jgi:hypothetical protein
VPGLSVAAWPVALWATLALAAVNTLLTSLLTLDEDAAFYRHVVKRLARAHGHSAWSCALAPRG